MSLSWSALHAQLLNSTQRMAFETQYKRIQKRHPEALPPGGVPGLLGFLHDQAMNSEAKNTALRVLVEAAQEDHPDTATTVLLLALWPGLDALRSRLRRQFPEARDTLDGDLLGRLTMAIQDCDLARVSNVAATLLMNTERDAKRALIRASQEITNATPLDELIDHLPGVENALSDDFSDVVDIDASRAVLCDVLGPDAHLVLLVVVGGCSQREAGALLGLSHDAARKRFQRAIARLKNLVLDCPIPPSGSAFPYQKHSNGKETS